MLQAPVEIKKHGNEKLLPNTLLSPASDSGQLALFSGALFYLFIFYILYVYCAHMHTHAYVKARDAEDNLLTLVLCCHHAGPRG